MIRFHDTETNEVIDREMTDAEHDTYLAEIAAKQLRDEQENAKKAAKEALYERLGITAEEAKLLLS